MPVLADSGVVHYLQSDGVDEVRQRVRGVAQRQSCVAGNCAPGSVPLSAIDDGPPEKECVNQGVGIALGV